MGDRLVVSVTSDRFVNKGPGRPRFTEYERAEALEALSCVDVVAINDAPDAVAMINHVRPAIYVKGIDYADATDDEGLRRESFAVAAVGGDMTFTSGQKWSSTELLPDFERGPFDDYLSILRKVECDVPFDQVLDMLLLVRTNRHRLFFIGNGGSAAIASHMAADWQKAGKTPAMCFNDAAQLTALANDCGYEDVFNTPIYWHGRDGDVLIAISSSGESLSIVSAAEQAHESGVKVVTLSGFKSNNQLRKLGDVNYYVPSDRYGIVETAHLAILHSLLDAAVDALR